MSPPSRVAAAALLIVGVVVCGLVPVVGGTPSPDTADQTDKQDPFGESPDVQFIANLETDGDARWNITTTVSLDTAEEVEAYRSTAEDFKNGELPPLGYSAFETGLAGVNGQTDREMVLTGPRRETATESEIESGKGRFTVEFTWENFMRSEENKLQIDRAVLVTESGTLWFPELDESEILTLRVPENYGVRDASVNTQNGELRWTGPERFTDETLQATFVGPGAVQPDDGNDDQPGEQSGAFPWIILPIAALGIAVAVLLSQSEQVTLDIPDELDVAGALSAGTSGAADETPEQERPDDGATTAGPDDDAEDDQIDTELLSDEERVERLLSQNGGRMKQADIVKETDWSNAKVSQLLSAMDEEGRIDKLRIGRENLISFPDEDVTNSEE
ncbi:helix-turn-helix transcriptional regulator [Halovenus halobia]|uniref:helix-turn-helix transcriptional regulator n=1 Tax=Halovenus halobia TaxID=3396622 RepID=UPI003F57275B